MQSYGQFLDKQSQQEQAKELAKKFLVVSSLTYSDMGGVQNIIE